MLKWQIGEQFFCQIRWVLTTTKPTKNKYSFSKLVDLENPTPEQVKAMQQELKRQMCMEEVSKKFEALAQELIRKKNGL